MGSTQDFRVEVVLDNRKPNFVRMALGDCHSGSLPSQRGGSQRGGDLPKVTKHASGVTCRDST